VAADAAFRANGVDTALEDIARQAGVAIGTLYRHFPSREALLEAIFHDALHELRREGEGLLEDPSPIEAFHQWLDALATHGATYRGLAQTILASFENETSALHAAHLEMQTVGAQLLARAQQAGDVRTDVDIQHLLLLVCGLTSAAEKAPDSVAFGRLLRQVMYDGLRPATPAS
jgi:AcrR family transcriptional regulator